MIKNFVCLNCQCKFVADDSYNPVCPICKSDNITIERGVATKYIISVCCFILFGVAGYLLPLKSDNGQNVAGVEGHGTDNQYGQAPLGTTSGSQNDGNVMSVNPEQLYKPMIVRVTEPVLAGETYSFDVAANVTEGKIIYEIRKEFGNELVANNNSGRFSGIPFSESGTYRVEVINSENPQYKDYRIVSGFTKPVVDVPKIKMLSKSEVQDYLNGGNLQKLNEFCHSVKVKIVNAGDIGGFNASDINSAYLLKKMGTIESFVVESLKYNDYNYIVAVNLRVIPKN